MARSVGITKTILSPDLCSFGKSIIFYDLPHLTYCIAVCGRPGSAAAARIQRTQKRADNVIVKYELYHRKVTDHLLSIESIFGYFTSVKLYKIFNEDQHSYFYDRIREAQVQHEHNTRFQVNYQLIPPFFRKDKCQRTFIYPGIDIWNMLPLNIRHCDSLSKFKKQLLKSFMSASQI